jgi:hypothetical protein
VKARRIGALLLALAVLAACQKPKRTAEDKLADIIARERHIEAKIEAYRTRQLQIAEKLVQYEASLDQARQRRRELEAIVARSKK